MSKKRKSKKVVIEPVESTSELRGSTSDGIVVDDFDLQAEVEPNEVAAEPSIERIEVPEPVSGAILVEEEVIVTPFNLMTCTAQELAEYKQRQMDGNVPL